MTQVAILGQGYVGLPLAVAAAQAGHDVIGVDLDNARVDRLNLGYSHISDVPSEQLRAVIEAGRYRAMTDLADADGVEIVMLCVPTPYLDDAPDLSFVRSAASALGEQLKPGMLVILESTTYPGTTEDVLAPTLQEASGLRSGVDFDLVFSPERIDPGNPRFGLRNTPKIVGGTTPAATRRAADFYRAFVEEVIEVSGPRTAEMAKLLENSFRHINIALVNELAVLSRDLGVDIWEAIEAAASKPFGFMPFYPGPGVGGHCIPVDPMYLSWRVRQLGGAARFIELAREVNAAMPQYCATRVQEILVQRGASLQDADVLLLGVAYKANVSDVREAPSLEVIRALEAAGANVRFHDPLVDALTLPDGRVLRSVELTAPALSESDAVVLVTDHDAIDLDWVVRHARCVFDTRGAITGTAPHVYRL